MNATSIVVRVPVVVLALLVALGAALNLGAGSAQAASDDQQWGFVDVPSAVEAGWQGPLTVSWRNFSGGEQTYRVTLAGPGVAVTDELVVPAEENSFRREVAVPALAQDGAYRAELTLVGSDEVLAYADIRVGAPRIVGLRADSRSISPAGGSAERRSVTTFGVDAAAGVSGRIVDATGRTILRRTFGDHVAGETMRWVWTGKDTQGRVVAAGRYTMQLAARTGDLGSTRTVALRVVR
ncbi:FlgD immunoglobulin-like domain containing protein [uncultured Nocardioides sp.]|uniref:FlgD immunoglobulin-like domain containing protein n=1 Tax=uncultured Nocardioides sp. TaxID=198441 RepID=UPI002626BF3F|nr:FlgD immunoglobulin-like domain containing protein [uncultured Nocardioides sp.]